VGKVQSLGLDVSLLLDELLNHTNSDAAATYLQFAREGMTVELLQVARAILLRRLSPGRFHLSDHSVRPESLPKFALRAIVISAKPRWVGSMGKQNLQMMEDRSPTEYRHEFRSSFPLQPIVIPDHIVIPGISFRQ
jgi:hypothetical protein